MARNPSDIQRLVSMLKVLAERDKQRHRPGTLQALESEYDHEEAIWLSEKVLLNWRTAIQSMNIGFDLVPDRHLGALYEEYDDKAAELEAKHARLEQARRAYAHTKGAAGNGNDNGGR